MHSIPNISHYGARKSATIFHVPGELSNFPRTEITALSEEVLLPLRLRRDSVSSCRVFNVASFLRNGVGAAETKFICENGVHY